MKIPYYQKLTLLDYPGKTAATIFTDGCNFRCPFCHNAALVVRHPEEYLAPDEVFAFLKKRTGLLDGICITGGEPLLQPDLEDFIKQIKAMGFLVKLDTNGSFPERLEKLLRNGLIDYVAMDIKNSPEKYPETIGINAANAGKIQAEVERSMKLIARLSPDYEFRTTAVASLHQPKDFESIASWISQAASPDAKYFIQCFRDSGDTIEQGLSALDENTLEASKNAALTHLKHVELRGI